MGRLQKRYDDISRSQDGESEVSKTYRHGEQQDIWEQIELIENFGGSQKAKSIEGALVQIGLASRLFQKVYDFAEGTEEKDSHQFDRLIYSAVAAICEAASIDMAELKLDHLLSYNMNPWTPYEDILAKLGEEHPDIVEK